MTGKKPDTPKKLIDRAHQKENGSMGKAKRAAQKAVRRLKKRKAPWASKD